jgi:hypothetical protein
MPTGEREHEEGDPYADRERSQHIRLRVSLVSRGVETASTPRRRNFLRVARNRLVGVTSVTGQVVAR